MLSPVTAEEAFARGGTCRICGNAPTFECRRHFVAENLELRAELERALLLIDAIAECAHDEECPVTSCDSNYCNCPAAEDDATEHVDPVAICTCVVAHAGARAASIRRVLAETLGNRASNERPAAAPATMGETP